MKRYLAIDIGASSGRHIVGWEENGEIKTDEVYRFSNGVKKHAGHLTWDIKALIEEVKRGIDKALEKYPEIHSLAIDTWGVDYCLMDGDKEISPCYAYRDDRTKPDEVHNIIAFADLYAKTGIQFQPFNTIYQLFDDNKTGRLNNITDFLMIPEYLNYKLTGIKKKEYTNATTTGLVNAATGKWDKDIINKLGLPEKLFGELCMPGAAVGKYKGIKVVLCASHDTASAVEGVPMTDNDLYLSSGTWSLLGAKIDKSITTDQSRQANYTNEGGVGYIRYLKNIMGMWVVNELKAELCPKKPFGDIISEAMSSDFKEIVDINADTFLAPDSMTKAFDKSLKSKPKTVGDYFSCAFMSLAVSYEKAINELESITGKSFDKLYIVGGGAKNSYLNALTAKYTGKQVIALPIEATAIGNLKIQMQGDKQ